MENTVENKQKFFSQYVGNENIIGGLYPDEELKADLTKNWFDWICNLNKWNESFLLLKPEPVQQYDVDSLRSNGYAVSYMGLSVKTLIEYGWVKII